MKKSIKYIIKRKEHDNMRKRIIFVMLVVACICTLGGCNKQVLDTTYKYNRAIIQLPDGAVIDGKIQSWTDFEDGDQIQVKIDGKTYLVHSSNVVLIDE